MADFAFTRGDGVHHQFAIETASWSAGGKLFFAAKPAVDDDNTDANSVINGEWDDSVTTDVVLNGVPMKQYDCYFPPSATNSIVSGGATSLDYLGEFQYVPTNGNPITVPATDDKLNVIVYMDIKRKTTV